MVATIIKTKAEAMLAEQFALALPGLAGNAAMKARRANAFAEFQKLGLPHKRIEAWHYTDLRNMMREAALPVLGVLPPNNELVGKQSDPLMTDEASHIWVNAAVREPELLPEGVEVLPIVMAMAANHPVAARIGETVSDAGDAMVALNSAMFSGGLVLRIAKGVRMEKPLHVSATMRMDVARAVNARSIIVVEEGAECTFVDSTYGPDGLAYQTNSVIEIIVEDNARCELVRCNTNGDAAQSLSLLSVSLGKNAEFNAFNMTTGAELSRTEVRVAARGAHSKIGIRGVNLLNREQHADTTLVVDHIAPNCESRELFRSVIDGAATGVFQGKIVVKREAQKTDGQMASNAILLTDNATMNNKPELEIFADDVVCAHGATCGALDEDLLFYLQARGLPQKEAEALMIQAFCGEAIEFVSHEPTRDALNGIVADWLKARAA